MPRAGVGLRSSALALRVLAVGTAAALAVVSWGQWSAWQAEQTANTRLVRKVGLDRRQPVIAERIRREPDLVHARIAIARALVAESLDLQSFASLPQREAVEEVGRISERLDTVEGIVTDAWVAHPASWEAPMLLGAARYLKLSRAGDPRLVEQRAMWVGPFAVAARLAPAEEEPALLAASATLEIWPLLSVDDQRRSREVLRRAFEDPSAFARLAAGWMAVAGSTTEAFSLVPDRPAAWQVVQGVLARAADWEGYCAARERWRTALRAQTAGRLREVEERLRGGDPSSARTLALEVVAALPPDVLFADALRRAMELCPPGPLTAAATPAANAWLWWSLEGFVRGHQLLPPVTIDRLAGVASVLQPSDRALAALAAGDLALAEAVERRNGALALEAWAPYWIAKARVLAQRGDAMGARRALDSVHRAWRNTPAELDARRIVAEAAGDSHAAVEATVALAALAAHAWPATVWRWRGAVASCDVVADREAHAVELAIDVVSERGAAVGVRWDHAVAHAVPVRAGKPVRLELPVSHGAHLLELTTLAGEPVTPGKVSVAPGG